MNEKISPKESARYFSRRAAGSLSLMRLSKETGLFPKSDGWRNVVAHMLVESEAVVVLAETLGLSDKERDDLRTAALLHDVFKRKEVEIYRKLGMGGYFESDKDQTNWVRSKGYSEDVITLMQSVALGLTNFVNGNGEIDPEFDNIPDAMKIAHFVDDITMGSQIVALDERIDALNRNKNYTELNESGRSIFGGLSYSDAQRLISTRIQADFSQRLGIADPVTLPFIIRDRIFEKARLDSKPENS